MKRVLILLLVLSLCCSCAVLKTEDSFVLGIGRDIKVANQQGVTTEAVSKDTQNQIVGDTLGRFFDFLEALIPDITFGS